MSHWSALASEVIASLSPKEREESIAYIEQRVFPAGADLAPVGIRRRFDVPVVVAFVDLEPAVNWTHRARYLVLGANGGVLETIEADRPPFLTHVSPDLRVIYRGRKAPGWAEATSAMLE